MAHKEFSVFLFFAIFCAMGCKENAQNNATDGDNPPNTVEREETAILKTLNDETKAAFERNYASWQEKWIHEPGVTKTYMDFTDSTFSESVGWDEISQFVKTFIEEHPDPEPIPKLIDKIDVRLYGNGAWVVFEQQDSLRGRKREARLMEKVQGEWKIAGMQTTIYGFSYED